jgi:two-component system chemotaxis response regulator CheY
MNAVILVADDDEFVREVLSTMLMDSDICNPLGGDSVHISEVIGAANGRRAVEVFMDRHPDLVLMDVVMPGMDGIEATKEIIVHDPRAVVLAITAFSSMKGQEMLEAGARTVISKPVKRAELLRIIAEHMS